MDLVSGDKKTNKTELKTKLEHNPTALLQNVTIHIIPQNQTPLLYTIQNFI